MTDLSLLEIPVKVGSNKFSKFHMRLKAILSTNIRIRMKILVIIKFLSLVKFEKKNVIA